MKRHVTTIDRDIHKLAKVLIVVFLFMLLEIWGHYASNSLSLLADSLHLFVDFLGIIISLISLKWAQRKANKRMSFGYGRYEIVGALISIFLIWIAAIYLVMESYQKVLHPQRINGKIFFVVSVIGVFVNVFCLVSLHTHTEKEGEHRNLNIRAAYIHIIGDLIQSAGVVAASVITVINPKWVVVDIACTICFSILVLFSTAYIVKDAIIILLEMTPKNVDIAAIQESLKVIDNFQGVSKLHCWNISANIKACAVVIRVSEIWRFESGMVKAKEILRKKWKFNYAIVEFETEKTANWECHRERNILIA